jgi:hypothetical protein
VFFGAPAGLPVRFDATCHAAESESQCHVTVTELSAERFRLATDTPADTLTIAVTSRRAMESARHLLVSVAQPTKLQLLAESDGTSGLSRTASAMPAIDPIQLSSAPRRTVLPLPGGGAITARSRQSQARRRR